MRLLCSRAHPAAAAAAHGWRLQQHVAASNVTGIKPASNSTNSNTEAKSKPFVQANRPSLLSNKLLPRGVEIGEVIIRSMPLHPIRIQHPKIRQQIRQREIRQRESSRRVLREPPQQQNYKTSTVSDQEVGGTGNRELLKVGERK